MLHEFNHSRDCWLLVWNYWVWKDTYSNIISEILWFNKIEIWKLLKEFKNWNHNKILVSDDIVFSVLDNINKKNSLFIWFPRNKTQYQYVRKNMHSPLMINLLLDQEVISKRLTKRIVCSLCNAPNTTDNFAIWDSCCLKACTWWYVKREEDEIKFIDARIRHFNNVVAPQIRLMKNDIDYIDIDLKESMNIIDWTNYIKSLLYNNLNESFWYNAY